MSFIAAPYDELALVVRQPTEDFSYTAFLAYDGDDVVAEGWYAAFLRANLDKAVVRPRVLPWQRRRGAGSAILARLEEHARADGRAIAQASPRWAMEYGPEGAGSPGVEFARKHGYPVRLVEAERRLALPVSAELLDELSARAAPAYEIRAFSGSVWKRACRPRRRPARWRLRSSRPASVPYATPSACWPKPARLNTTRSRSHRMAD